MLNTTAIFLNFLGPCSPYGPNPKEVFFILFFFLEKIVKNSQCAWLLRRRVSIIQTDVSDGMVYLMKLKQTMKMAQGTLEGAAQNFERLSV